MNTKAALIIIISRSSPCEKSQIKKYIEIPLLIPGMLCKLLAKRCIIKQNSPNPTWNFYTLKYHNYYEKNGKRIAGVKMKNYSMLALATKEVREEISLGVAVVSLDNRLNSTSSPVGSDGHCLWLGAYNIKRAQM